MPNKRAKGQTIIAVSLPEKMLEQIDLARGSDARSLFLRKAAASKIRQEGGEIAEELVPAPDRVRTKKPPIPFRLDEELIQRLDALASTVNLSRADVVRLCILRTLDAAEARPTALLEGITHNKKA